VTRKKNKTNGNKDDELQLHKVASDTTVEMNLMQLPTFLQCHHMSVLVQPEVNHRQLSISLLNESSFLLKMLLLSFCVPVCLHRW